MRTALRTLFPLLVVALPFAACTNDYNDYEFTDTPGTTGGGGSGGTDGGGTGGVNIGGTGATPAGGTGGINVGGAGGTAATGGTGGTAGTGATGATGGTGGSTACQGNTKLCAAQCVPLNDPQYGCGPTSCDPCPALANATVQCAQGQCALQTCTAGFDNCDGNAGTGCEQQLNTTAHCGQCARACSTTNSTGATCADSKCSHKCATGFADCAQPATGPDDGCEIDTSTDKAHCGSCSNNCGPLGANGGFGCIQGQCGCTASNQCDTGGGLTNVSCVVATGLCSCDGTTCRPGEECGKQQGNTMCRCNGQAACSGSETCCASGGCKNLDQDVQNCGACGKTCATGQKCENGQCTGP